MRVSFFGLTVGVNRAFLSLSCERFEVVFRWSAVFSPRVEAWSETGRANGRAWKTADAAYGPFEVTRFSA
jgi:hypothetical protein